MLALPSPDQPGFAAALEILVQQLRTRSVCRVVYAGQVVDIFELTPADLRPTVPLSAYAAEWASGRVLAWSLMDLLDQLGAIVARS